MRFLCQVSSVVKFPKFPTTTALQRCKLSLTDFTPPLSFTVYGIVPFICSFHDSQVIRPCLDSLLVGEMGIVRDDFAVVY